MKKNLWEKDAYYSGIQDSRVEAAAKDPTMIYAANVLASTENKKVLDVGCGEGWFIENFSRNIGKNNSFVGVDVSSKGINMAKQRDIPNAEFLVYDGDRIPFPDNTFDVVVSNFVFEHLYDPYRVFQEIARVAKKGAMINIMCPNFGSPLFKSPCNRRSKALTMPIRFLFEFMPAKFFKKDFRWNSVEPIDLPEDIHIPDYDTLSEPSLSSFEKYLRNHRDRFKVIKLDSLWESYTYENAGTYSTASGVRKALVRAARHLGIKQWLRFQYFGSFFCATLRKLD